MCSIHEGKQKFKQNIVVRSFAKRGHIDQGVDVRTVLI
jgi:hypothetical protein